MVGLLTTLLLSASPTGLVAYVSDQGTGDRCVYVMNVATREATRVGPGRGDGAPRWSRDGEWITFETSTESGTGICLVRWDGSDSQYLNHRAEVNRDPQWSRDGTKLAYTAGEGADRQVAVYDMESGEETIWGGGHTGLIRPVWISRELLVSLVSPEERSIRSRSFSFRDPRAAVGLVAVGLTEDNGKQSTDLFLVTESETVPFPARALPGPGTYAEWAPAPAWGTYAMAFESDDGGDREIFLFSRRGTWDITNHRSADWNPVWAPRFKWMAFESFREGRRGIYRVHRDTGRVVPIVSFPDADHWSPSWSPDGEWIVFLSNRTGGLNLFVAEVRGDARIQLTDQSSREDAPAWRPVR